MKTKAIKYAYPTSNLADELGFKDGVYYCVIDESPMHKKNPHIAFGAEKLSDCRRMAETRPEPWEVFCGKTLDGTSWGPSVYLRKNN